MDNVLILLGILMLAFSTAYSFRTSFFIMVILIVLYQNKTFHQLLYTQILPKQLSTSHPQTLASEKENKQVKVLYKEGNSILHELKSHRTNANQTIFISIKNAWKRFIKLSQSIIDNKKATYQHHYFSTLIDLRKFILNQMSALIVSSKTISLHENTLMKERTLPMDTHIRILIRKMGIVINNILDITKISINENWHENPYSELSPVEWQEPQGYNQNTMDPII
jgi:hypothetical protein